MAKNILIAYYTHSGNTEKIAKLIAEATGGTLFEVNPMEAYPVEYNAVVEQAKVEIKAGFLPELMGNVPNFASYDAVFIGSPNWWSTIAPPIATFLTTHDTGGKTVIPFITHGGGGIARMFEDMAKLAPNATMAEGLSVYNGGTASTENEVARWIEGLGI